MIKVEYMDTWGFEHAIRGMRNPMNSWDKSDSKFDVQTYWDEEHNLEAEHYDVIIGENDLGLMRKLYKAGVEHRTYARMIQVSMDITAPLYWWKEMDRYTIGKSQVSCSTMHKIAEKEFTLDDFSHEHLLGEVDKRYANHPIGALQITIECLNNWRAIYLETKDKDDWWQMIQLLPSSYNQRRTICMSYETVFKIIKERTGHKLDEWNKFVDILKTLPYIKEITGGTEECQIM